MINLNEALSIYIMESQVLHDKRNMLFTYGKNNCLSYSDDPVVFNATFGDVDAIEINTINVIDKKKRNRYITSQSYDRICEVN